MASQDPVAAAAAQEAALARVALAQQKVAAAAKAAADAQAQAQAQVAEAARRSAQAMTDAAGRARNAQGQFVALSNAQTVAAAQAAAQTAASQATIARSALMQAQRTAEQGSAATRTAQKVAQVGDAVARHIVSGGARAVQVIQAIGLGFAALATMRAPDAIQAMTALGATVGGFISGAGAKLNEGLGGLADKLGEMGPEGAVGAAGLRVFGAAAEATTAIVGATIGTLTQMMGVAISVTERLTLLRDSFSALAGGARQGAAAQAAIAGLNLPFATAQVNEWAASLLGAGVAGKQLTADVKAIAAAEALMKAAGGGGGAAASELFKRLAEGGAGAQQTLSELQKGSRKAEKMLHDMGLNLADLGGQAALAKMSAEQLHEALAKALARKGAGPLADVALTMESILTKAQEGLLSIFARLGPAVGPFMKAVKDLFSQFNKGSPIVKALGKDATAIFGLLFGKATLAVQAITKVVKTKDFMTGLRDAFVVFGAVLNLSLNILINVVKWGAQFIAWIGRTVGPIKTSASSIEDMSGKILGLASALLSCISPFFAVIDAFQSADIIGGLVAGLDPSRFISAMVDVARQGMAAFQAVLGIHSDSTVFKAYAGHMVGGLETGADDNAPRAQRAMSRLVDPKALKMPAGKGSGGGLTVNVNGPIYGTQTREGVRSIWYAVLEEDALAGPEASST